jgi:hypothetical protein
MGLHNLSSILLKKNFKPFPIFLVDFGFYPKKKKIITKIGEEFSNNIIPPFIDDCFIKSGVMDSLENLAPIKYQIIGRD